MEQKRLVVRFKNLPERDTIEIKNLRSKHIKKLIAIKGIIKQASEVGQKSLRRHSNASPAESA